MYIKFYMYALTYKLIFLIGIIILFTFSFWILASDAKNWNNRNSDNDLSLFDCSYFVVVTFSTIGYGDLSPKSNIARILTMMLTIIVIMGLMDLFAELLILNYKKLDLDDTIPSYKPAYNNEDLSTRVELASELTSNNFNKRHALAKEILLNN